MTVSGLLNIFNDLPAFGKLVAELDEKKSVPALTLPTSARTAVLAQLYLQRNVPVLLITGKVESAAAWIQALETWLPPGDVMRRLPEPTPLPNDRGPWSERCRADRLTVLTRLMAGQHPQMPALDLPPLIVTSARAFLQKTLPKRRFMTSTRVLRVGQIIDLEKITANWLGIGYEEVSVVEAAGQFSRRGGIIDIFPIATLHPVRIELFGDEIDTMRTFDPATQRSIEVNGSAKTDMMIVPPTREALPSVAAEFALSLADEVKSDTEGASLPSWRDDVPDLQGGKAFPNLEYYLPLLYPQPASLLDYLPNDALVVVDDWRELATAVAELQQHADQIANEQVSLPPNYQSPLFAWEQIRDVLNWWQPLILGDGEGEDEPERPYLDLASSFEPGPRYGGQVRPLLTQLKSAQQEGDRVVVLSQQAARLQDLWREELRDIPPESLILRGGLKSDANGGELSPGHPNQSLSTLPQPGSLTFIQGALPEGFVLVRREDDEILLDLLTDAEIFGWNRPAPRRWRSPRPIAPEARFADITAGDYVVHLEYGIGRFAGLVSRNIGGMQREYLLMEYANGDTLYVPAHHADRLSKWVGSDERPPTMHRLGERSWTQAKAKAQKAADELADDLLDLYATRETIAGHAFSPDSEWQAELEASFPYRETEDQLRVITEVKTDMEQPQPMDRLVCGDVGYGKTEVALRAAFKAVMDSKQVAILVPTTVLAQQHYNTFYERLRPFPVTVQMLSRFRTHAQQQRIVKQLRNGRIDIIIGTHRLLSDDISFKDLGLVIVDEEQRFGVAHKEKLKQWRTEVDVLTMTATPIPRTLYMSLTGVRNISIIDTAPAERLPVQTYVGAFDETRLKRALQRELDRGGQVFLVHNRVQTIDIIHKQIERLVPEARVAIGHGQMSERQLERIMTDFDEGKIDVLISTTIIESGLDIPNANTLIVDRADRFGLAQMYQLRGRVGRGAKRAYAYFFHAPWRTLNEDARLRLETIAEQTDLGAGYQIALRDMEIRGAGDLLGGAQSGHISAVGFDLYTKLLANAVKRRKAERKGEVLPAELPEATLIDVPLAAYVPPDYVPDPALRLRLYRRMAMLGDLVEIDEMAEELADRFGPIPDPVHHLLYQLRIKVLAERAQVTAVTTEAGQIKIRLLDLEGIDRFRLQRFLGEAVRVSRKAIWMPRDLSTKEWQVTLVQVLERLASFERDKMKLSS
ncbi:transcription-repair coupling factor [Candidatus Leptofilum sp.]|uniref:transcription-repair coupling factor n=1 Tax=Candidatus Leptofilum sp. TaxID=3241576 RepID=UPI003B59D978